jgi:hypothetical protein
VISPAESELVRQEIAGASVSIPGAEVEKEIQANETRRWR